MERSFILYIIFCFLLLNISCKNKDLEDYTPEISITPNKISCNFCWNFGSKIEAENNDLVVADYQTLYFFEMQNQSTIIHSETIDFGIEYESNTSGIQELLIRNGMLYVGIADPDGTGTVYIYQKEINGWEEIQRLRIGRHQDNFGIAIDVSDEFLVIGANAPWLDNLDTWANTDEGRLYIYRKSTTGWELDRFFSSETSLSFGETVAIYGNYILAGSIGSQLHIYHYEGEWVLERIEPINPAKISHDRNHFIIRNEFGVDPSLYSFYLLEDGQFEYDQISLEFYQSYLGDDFPCL